MLARTQGLYCFGLCLGTLYSVPPFRLKVSTCLRAQARLQPELTSPQPQRFPLPAFMIIATVRGFLLNFGVYHATRSALLLPFEVRQCVLPEPAQCLSAYCSGARRSPLSLAL